jgi:protein-disulfide isomerase
MFRKNKNKEGKNKLNKKDEVKKIKIKTSQISKSNFSEGMTLDDMKEKSKKEKLIKNLVSVIIIISGLFLGSLFVDVTQLLTKNGYSERALRGTEVFELGDKTWVAYQEPAIKVSVLTVENEEECPACNADEILGWMKKFIPTMLVNEIVDNSAEGKYLIEKYQLKTIPSFIFDEKIEHSSFYQEEQVQEIFEKKADGLVLNAASLGIPAGKYLDYPREREGDIVIGKKDAQVKLVTFFDFQSAYSRIFYEAVKEARKEFNGEQLVLVYKTFPSDLQEQSINASLVGQCAYQQGRFEEMADLLFKNQEEWLLEEDFKIFDKYVSVLRLNKQEFNECINSEKSRGLIQELVDQGNNFGIAGTPTSFMNNEYLEGVFQKEDIVKAINEKLKKEGN